MRCGDIYRNNKNGARYMLMYEIPDCSEGRENKEIVVYINTVSRRAYAREKEEFCRKFTKEEE